MFCTNCGNNMPDGSAFCSVCGTPTVQSGQQATNSGQQMNAYGGISWQASQNAGNAQQSQYNAGPAQGGYQQSQFGPGAQGGYQQNQFGPGPQGGYQQNQFGPGSQGGGWQQNQFGPGPYNRNQNNGKSKKGGLIAVIIILAVLLIGGGITAIVLLTGKGGASSAKEATENVLKAFNEGDYEAVFNATPDEMYDKIYVKYKDIFQEWDMMGADASINSGKDLKENLIKRLSDQFDEMNNEYKEYYGEGISLSANFIAEKEMPVSEITGYIEGIVESGLETSGMLDLYKDYDAVSVCTYNLVFQFGDEIESEIMVDICYKENGKWYSTLGPVVLLPAITAYSDKSQKADDVSAAGTIYTAISAALANEDAYTDYKNVTDGTSGEVIVATAKAGEKFECINGYSMPTFINEVNNYLNSKAPKIYYTGDGQQYWSIGIDMYGNQFVCIGSSPGANDYKLSPDIDDEYK